MRAAAYQKRLAEDLPKWRAAGWVTADGATAILAATEGRRSAFGLAAIIGMLGALLIGLGIIAFVGANWEAMPRITRFGLLIAALAVAYLAAGVLRARDLRVFSEAALLLSGLVFAAAIALIGQTYHLSGDFAGAVMLWEIGMIAAALLAGSATLTTLALLGAGYWAWLGTVEAGVLPHWPSLAVILVGGVIATFLDSRMARIISILAFGFWVGLTVIAFADRQDWPFAGTMALLAVAALVIFSAGALRATLDRFPKIAALGEDMIWPGLAATLVALGLEQTITFWTDSFTSQLWVMPSFVLGILAVLLASFAYLRKGVTALEPIAVAVLAVAAIGFAMWNPDGKLEARLAGGAIVLAAAVWVTSFGHIGRHRGKALGLLAFGAEVLYLYIVTLGTQMDTALAFLGGGVLFIVLAFGLFRLDRSMARRGRPVEPVPAALGSAVVTPPPTTLLPAITAPTTSPPTTPPPPMTPPPAGGAS